MGGWLTTLYLWFFHSWRFSYCVRCIHFFSIYIWILLLSLSLGPLYTVQISGVDVAQDTEQPPEEGDLSSSDDENSDDVSERPISTPDNPTLIDLSNVQDGTEDTELVEPTIAPPEGHTWWHVDTGANSVVTNRINDVNTPIPIDAFAKTAQKGATAKVTAIGELQLSGVDKDHRLFRYRSKAASVVPGFHRRSLSGHEMRRFGWRFVHDVGERLKLLPPGATQWIVFDVHTEFETDFVALRIEYDEQQPVETRAKLIACAINLARTLGGHSLALLWHLRFGCISMPLLKEMCKQRKCEGLPITLSVPDNFACPICDITNAKAVARQPSIPSPIARKGVRWGADFLFPGGTSVRGFKTVLLLTEEQSGAGFVFPKLTKHAPISVLKWFIQYARKRLGVAFACIRCDGGGELYNNHQLRHELAEMGTTMEPTGTYNPSANGQTENMGGIIKNRMRALLYAGGMDGKFWCIAICHAAYLTMVIGRRIFGYNSPHYMLYGTHPHGDHLRILFSNIYVKHMRKSKRGGNPQKAMKYRFAGFHGSPRIKLYLTESNGVRYAHHASIDEQQLDCEPQDRNPAGKLLARLPDNVPLSQDLKDSIDALDLSPRRWSDGMLRSFEIPGLSADGGIGLHLEFDPDVHHCKIHSVISDTPLASVVPQSQVRGHYLLEVNGCKVRTPDDVLKMTARMLDMELSMSGFSILIGLKSRDDTAPEDKLLAPIDGNAQRMVWGIDMLPEASVPIGVWSISANPEFLPCPANFQRAMRGPYKDQWKSALFKHLDKNAVYGTLGLPVIPTVGKTVLDPILAVKHKLDEFNRLDERKVRLCAHGGQQLPGFDYDESYAPAILGSSLRMLVALSAWLGLDLYHADVSNAFQSTPDPTNSTYLRCFPEYLEWIALRFPEHYAELLRMHPGKKPHEFAMMMYTYVQGRTEASRKWRELIDRVLIKELRLIPNRADACIYSGVVEGDPLILGRATDDFLMATTSRAYDKVVHTLRFNADGTKRWDIHAFGLATFFFGVRIIQSRDAVSLDQRPFSFDVLMKVDGKEWLTQPRGDPKKLVPLPHGSAFEAELASETPLLGPDLTAAEHHYGFKFRTVLGQFSHLSSWTRQDMLTATTRVAQYQSAPGHAHFRALRRMLSFLRHTYDRGLVYKRTQLGVSPGCATTLSVTSIHQVLSSITAVVSLSPGVGDHVCLSADGTSPVHTPLCVQNITVWSSPFGAVENRRLGGDAASRVTQVSKSTQPVMLIPPPTDGDMDANHGSVFETVGFSGVLFMMMGTLIMALSQKQSTIAYNTAESELYAATAASKMAKWIRVWMLDIGLPYTKPIAIGEDNNACRIIAHGGKLTRNVRHIAIQTAALQRTIQERLIAMYAKPSADNRSDFFTKLLGAVLFWEHSDYFMGTRFLTDSHRSAIRKRNQQSSTTSKTGTKQGEDDTDIKSRSRS